MSANNSAQQARRPFLTLVKGLELDKVPLPQKTKASLKKSRRLSLVPSQGNHTTTIVESNRNCTLTSMAGVMRRKGMSQSAIEAALLEENSAKCLPPLADDEVCRIAASVARYEPELGVDIRQSLNDVGNARRFAAAFKSSVAYSPGMGWLIWDGQKWTPDTSGTIVEKAKEAAKAIYNEGQSTNDDDLRIAIAKHAKASLSARAITAMLDLAKSDPDLRVEANSFNRDDLLLGVANGVVDLRTGKLRPASINDRITNHSGVHFDTNAKAPTFEKFLNTATGGNKSLQGYLQRVVGYSLTGKTSEQCLFFLHGGGSNGKSTFLNVLKELLGSDLSAQTPSETLMNRKNSQPTNDIARLVSKRVVVANEVEEGSMLSEAFVKQITGGEQISARFHYKEFFEFVPKFKLFIAGNHRPTIRGRDNGIWRRIHLIPFTVAIDAKHKDPALMEKLRAELPGILNWAIKGTKAWQRAGLMVPKIVTDATNSYRKEMDLIQAWIDADATVSPPSEWQVRRAYGSYSEWAISGGYKPMSESVFSRELESKFQRVKRKDANYFQGIGPKTYLP